MTLDKFILRQQVYRLLITLAIFYSELSPLIKIVLILGIDLVKNVYFFNLHEELPTLSNNKLYQDWDKVQDTFAYFLVLCLINTYNLITDSQKQILTLLLTIRTAGVVQMLRTGDRKILLYFPDLFKETLLLFLLTCSFKLKVVIGVLLLVFKLWLEYNFHVKKRGIVEIFKSF